MMRKREMTSGRSQENSFNRHHVERRVKLYVPKEETFPIPTKYIDVTRTTHTSLDVMMEKHVEDYWNVDGEKRLVRCMDWLHKICSVKGKATGRICMVRSETHEGTNNLSSRQCMARNVEAYVWCSKEESKTKMGYRETKTRQWEQYNSSSQTMKNSNSKSKLLEESWKFRCQQQCLAKYQ